MAPKKKAAPKRTRKGRQVGLLGQLLYDSDEDEDWAPGGDTENLASPRRKAQRKAPVDAQASSDPDDDILDVPLARRRRAKREGCEAQCSEVEQERGRPQRGRQPREGGQPQQQVEPQPAAWRSTRTRNAPPRGSSGTLPSASTAAAAAPAAGEPRDWGGLTAPLLTNILRRACAASALPTAAAAACVYRHWRDVCADLEAQAVAAAAAAAAEATADAAAAARNAWALAAARNGVASSAAGGSSGAAAAGRGATASVDTAGAAGRGPSNAGPGHAPGATTKAIHMTAVVASSSAEDPMQESDSGGARGLWSCLDVRSRPSARLSDEVIQRGLRTRRWMQVSALRLGDASNGALSPDGLLALARDCPGLTCLELSQCDSLLKPEQMRAVLSSLPRLQLLDISHCAALGLDQILKAALAPRALPAGPQPGGSGRSGAGRKEGGQGAGGNGGGWALPCPLRVLRARGCPRLGAMTLKALAPEAAFVTLPPPPRSSPASPASPSSSQPHRNGGGPAAVPLFVHLTELDLTGSGALSRAAELAVERLQAAAPNLRVLRLDATGSAIYMYGLRLGPEPEEPGPGFPMLRVCELGLSRSRAFDNSAAVERHGSTLDLLRRVVGRSPHLRTLDVSGPMSRGDTHTLAVVAAAAAEYDPKGHNLPGDDPDGDAAAAAAAAAAESAAVVLSVVDSIGLGGGCGTEVRVRLRHSLTSMLPGGMWGPLRVLRASRSLLASDAGLHAVAARWGRTLQVLDVSESCHVTDAGLLHVAHRCTALTSLDVSATAITDWGLRCLLALRPTASDVGAAAGAGGTRQGGGTAGAIDLVSDSDDGDGTNDPDHDGGNVGEGGGKGGGGVALRHLDISSCRGVDRATRHSAAEGLGPLRAVLGM